MSSPSPRNWGQVSPFHPTETLTLELKSPLSTGSGEQWILRVAAIASDPLPSGNRYLQNKEYWSVNPAILAPDALHKDVPLTLRFASKSRTDAEIDAFFARDVAGAPDIGVCDEVGVSWTQGGEPPSGWIGHVFSMRDPDAAGESLAFAIQVEGGHVVGTAWHKGRKPENGYAWNEKPSHEEAVRRVSDWSHFHTPRHWHILQQLLPFPPAQR